MSQLDQSHVSLIHDTAKRFSRAIASSVGVKISLSGARVLWPPFQATHLGDIFWRNDTTPSLELFQAPRIAIRQGGGWVNQLRRHFATSSTSSGPGNFVDVLAFFHVLSCK
jgi:hypothetical protein